MPRFDPGKGGELLIPLEATRAAALSPLFPAIAGRQSSRTEFDGTPVSSADPRILEQAGTGPGVQVILLSERAAMEKVLEHVVAANSAQMGDAAFVAELKQWIRFSAGEALRSGDGLYSITQPTEDPRSTWIEVGRAYERFALQATALGIRNAFVNQPVEVAGLRPGFAESLGVGKRRPDLVVRFGRGPGMPRSLRRPLESVLAA